EIERDQLNQIRIVTGISPDMFSWRLEPGESFEAPEVILSYTGEGFEALSHTLHRFMRRQLLPKRWQGKRRPVLINNWEATYFDFTTDKIVGLAETAKQLGIELLVLDDGWFGTRNSDNTGLGDWQVNETKLPGGLKPLIDSVRAKGLGFGIWIEPEMVNEDSALYKAHPDWALTVPGRVPAMSRNQLVLDMGNPEVRDYLFGIFSDLLRSYPICYVKWDMNRHMTDVYSHCMPSRQQGEVFHRNILGVYDLADRLTKAFPDVLWEGCSGGGGRFDAGMLHYFPQIWLSDNTDAIDRLDIQYGSSFAYPGSTISAHVSACPNHQSGRTVPIGTRALVAMTGAFGYELDPAILTDEEKAAIPMQIERYKRYAHLFLDGDYYRLAYSGDNGYYTAWSYVSEDKREALVSVVVTRTRANYPGAYLKLRGLDPSASYRLDEVIYEGVGHAAELQQESGSQSEKKCFKGSTLLHAGYVLPQLSGDYPGMQLHFVRED
ncbi:MAG: alpha-galactosidase, partial [Clostridia bacterium]|nr:alpha-galactosidase [Clostridia bacterium]